MDRIYIEKQDLLHRYRRNELSKDEAAEFEEFFLDKPDLLERLELDHWIQHGIRSSVIGPIPVARTSRPAWQLALAASVFLTLGASLIYNVQLAKENRRIQAVVSAFNSEQVNVAVLELAAQRSQDPVAARDREALFRPVATLMKGSYDGRILLHIRLHLPASESYTVQITKHGTSTIILQVDGVIPKGVGDLLFSVPAASLPSGDYVLKARGEANDSIELQFRVAGEGQ